MVKFTEEEILLGIKEQNSKVLNYIYDEYFNNIKAFVIKNNGNYKDAEDIFQEAIIAVFRKIKDEHLTLSCSFSTYLFSICNKLWLKHLKYNKSKRKQKIIDLDYFSENDIYEEEDDEILLKNERYKLFQTHFKKLSKTCQKILKLALKNLSFKKVANKTTFKNAESAKRKKYKCKKQLIENIKSDPSFNQIMNN